MKNIIEDLTGKVFKRAPKRYIKEGTQKKHTTFLHVPFIKHEPFMFRDLTFGSHQKYMAVARKNTNYLKESISHVLGLSFIHERAVLSNSFLQPLSIRYTPRFPSSSAV